MTPTWDEPMTQSSTPSRVILRSKFASGNSVAIWPLCNERQLCPSVILLQGVTTHACFMKCAKSMTLFVLETSLPMQRSHDTLAPDISAHSWCAKQNVTRGYIHFITKSLYQEIKYYQLQAIDNTSSNCVQKL